MSVKQSLNTIIDAYKEGILPSGLYFPGIGNAPMSNNIADEDSPYMDKVIANFELFKTVFNVDGGFNPRSSVAESYAISLALDEKYAASIKMFDTITSEGFNIVVRGGNEVPPMVNKFGLLGFEGTFQYAGACLEYGKKDQAKKLYGMIADLPRKCHGEIRFGDVKVHTLEVLINVFGLDRYNSSLLVAKKKQY